MCCILALMRISLTWLQDFIEFNENDPQIIADEITAHTAEVDEVEVMGRLLKYCCVGKVLTVESHPNADRLSLCDVETDKGKKRVVCGGTNLRAGMRVAFAHVGATVLWHGGEKMTLEPVKIRGEQSEGMICAAEELGLEKVFPDSVETLIIDIGDGDEGVGTSLQDYLGLNDVVLHIDNHAITHRADLFSHIGFARECVAMGIAKWKKKPEYTAPTFAKDALPFKIHNENELLVPRYACCLIEIDELGETPDFMKSRLAAADWRSINLPVDITNFVSTELGMPLHSFDSDDIQGDVHMRTAKKGEKITTLDEEERELPEGALVLSDDEGIFDLLGIMGGLRSSTTEKTRRIFLHSPAVDPVSIRRAIIATGHRTEASTVYEKGIPPVVVEQGFYRALELILEHIPGARVVSAMQSWGEDGSPESIELSADRVRSYIGEDIPTPRIAEYLEGLEFNVQVKDEQLLVTPPLHRIGDIAEPHDLIEEVARMYGLNKITPRMPDANTDIPERDFRIQDLRRELQLRSFVEIVPLSLVGPELLKKCGLDPSACAEIANPIGEELSLMQPSTLPRLLEHAGENIMKEDTVLKTFHIGTVFGKEDDRCKELGLLHSARKDTELLHDPFLSLKRDLCDALSQVGYECTVQQSKPSGGYEHPGRCADVYVHEKRVGSLFEVLHAVREKFDLPARTAAAIVDLTAVLAFDPVVKIASPLAQFPPVVYDETITVNHDKHVNVLLEKAQKTSELLEKIETADLYKDRLTLRFTYRASDRTLTEEDAKKEHGKVMGVFA